MSRAGSHWTFVALSLLGCQDESYHATEYLVPRASDAGVVFVERRRGLLAEWTPSVVRTSWLSETLHAQDVALLGERVIVLGDGEADGGSRVELQDLRCARTCRALSEPLPGVFDRITGSTGDYALAYNDPRYGNPTRSGAGTLALFRMPPQYLDAGVELPAPTSWLISNEPGNLITASGEFPIEDGVQWVPPDPAHQFFIITYPSTLVVLHMRTDRQPEFLRIDLRDTANSKPFNAKHTIARFQGPQRLSLAVRGSGRNDLIFVTATVSATADSALNVQRIETSGIVEDMALAVPGRLAALVQPGDAGSSTLELREFSEQGEPSAPASIDLSTRFDRVGMLPGQDGESVLVALERPPGTQVKSGAWEALTSAATDRASFVHTTTLSQPIAHWQEAGGELWLFSLNGEGGTLAPATQLVRSFALPGPISPETAPVAQDGAFWALSADRTRAYLLDRATLSSVAQTLPALAPYLFPLAGSVPRAVAVHAGALVRLSYLEQTSQASTGTIKVDEQRFLLLEEVARRP